MSKESEVVEKYLKEIRSTKKINVEELEARKKRKEEKNTKMEKIDGETEKNHLKEFNKLGIIDLFREISESKIVIQDDDYKWMGAVEKAVFTFDRHIKKISLLFDDHQGGHHDESEFGHRVTISLPFKNGINIHGFEDGERITRQRIEFKKKDDEEIKLEIAATVARFIGELQGFTELSPERVSFEEILNINTEIQMNEDNDRSEWI